MDKTVELSYYEKIAKNVRKTTLDLVHRTKSPHIGPSFSMVEILVALYFRILNNTPENPLNPLRDRFILSKGHACPSLYAVLAEKGFLKQKELNGFAVDGGFLEQHPIRDVERGIELSTGSLGHGLSVGAGMALAAKRDGKKYRVFVLLGCGEMNEGSVWEAVMFASQHKLDNLVAIVDYNKMQAYGCNSEVINLEPLAQKWLSFGWSVREINGHDFKQLFDTFDAIPLSQGKPNVIISNTIKGKGVSFMEGSQLWHYRSPDEQEREKALRELFL